MKDTPLYLIDVDDDVQGVTAISLVDNPAMRTQWLTFSATQPKEVELLLFDNERHIVASPIINVDMPIPRTDKKGNTYNIVFTKEAAEKIAYKFMADKRQNDWNLEHSQSRKVQSVTLVESYIVDREKGKGTPKGHEFVADGSWYGFAKINDLKLWEEIKKGNFNGFSLEGVLYEVPVEDEIEEQINELANILNQFISK